MLQSSDRTQFRDICTTKITVYVVIEGLFDWVEYTTASRVVTATACVLPVAPVAVSIIVDEKTFVQGGADAPIQGQVLRHKAGDVLPCSIGCVTKKVKLSHAGIDKANATRPSDETVNGLINARIVTI